MSDRQPIFNVPGTVLAILALFIAIQASRSLMSDETALWWVLTLAFIPARYSGLAAELPGGDVASFTSVFTHMVTHADVVHLGVNSAWLLAFGSVLCRRMGSARFIGFSIGGGLAGAALFYVMNRGLAAPMIGASGAIAAMMGGVMRFLFRSIDDGKGYLLRDNPAAIARMTIAETLSDRRIIIASLVFIGLNLLTIVGFGTMGATGAVAWEAHIGGYAFGLLAFALFDTASHNASPTPAEVD